MYIGGLQMLCDDDDDDDDDSASSWEPHLAQVWITQFYLQTHHTCLYRIVRQRAPQLNEQL